MEKPLFLALCEGVAQQDPDFFTQRSDCTGKLGAHPLQKITAAVRILAYGTPADAVGCRYFMLIAH
jgi:hypothetical protein